MTKLEALNAIRKGKSVYWADLGKLRILHGEPHTCDGVGCYIDVCMHTDIEYHVDYYEYCSNLFLTEKSALEDLANKIEKLIAQREKRLEVLKKKLNKLRINGDSKNGK